MSETKHFQQLYSEKFPRVKTDRRLFKYYNRQKVHKNKKQDRVAERGIATDEVESWVNEQEHPSIDDDKP